MSHFEIYIEGSGDTGKLQQVGREAMRKFLSNLNINGSFQPIMCGSREQAYKEFCWATNKIKAGVIPLLLVDAETLMDKQNEPWTHLKASDNWNKPEGATNDHAYLMVQTMEAWLVCDPSAWKQWKPRIDSSKLPAIHNNNVQLVGKEKLEEICEGLCKSINLSYLKQKRLNGFGILKSIKPKLVRDNSLEAARFFDYLEGKTRK